MDTHIFVFFPADTGVIHEDPIQKGLHEVPGALYIQKGLCKAPVQREFCKASVQRGLAHRGEGF